MDLLAAAAAVVVDVVNGIVPSAPLPAGVAGILEHSTGTPLAALPANATSEFNGDMAVQEADQPYGSLLVYECKEGYDADGPVGIDRCNQTSGTDKHGVFLAMKSCEENLPQLEIY